MKNQLRKATLRAAAVAMSATIAASSMPLTALANEGNDGNNDEGVAQTTQKKSAEKEVQDAVEPTNDAVENANTEVQKIDFADNIATKEMKDEVSSAKEATKNAAGKEENVKSDANAIVEKKSEVDTATENLEDKVDEASEIVTEENNNQETLYNRIDEIKAKIEGAEYKEDVQALYNEAIAKANQADGDFETAQNNLSSKMKEYTSAKSDLEGKLKAYETAIGNGVKDLKAIEDEIAIAQNNVEVLKGQVQSASKNLVAKTAAEKLADKYNDANANKKEVFDEIVKDYYIIGKDAKATNIVIGEYDGEHGVYPVSYTNGKGENVKIYLSCTDNKNDNGITIEEKEIKTVLEKPAVVEHYVYGDNNTTLSVSDYNSLNAKGAIIEVDGKTYLASSGLQEVVKVGENNVTGIENKAIKVNENGIIEVTGDVTTVVKTANSLNVESKTTYADKSSAESAANAEKEKYEKDGYEKVNVEYKGETQYTAAVGIVETETFTKTIKNSNDHEYNVGDILNKSNNKRGFLEERSKYVLRASNTPNYGWVDEGGWFYSDWQYKEVSKTWTVDYAKISTDTVNQTTWSAFLDLFKEDKDKVSTNLQNAVKNNLMVNGGFIVDYQVIDGNWNTATVYVVKGTRFEAVGNSEEEAKFNLEELLKTKNLSGVRTDITTKSEVIVPYSYKITGTKVETTTNTTNTVVESSIKPVDEVTHIAAAKAEYTDKVSTVSTYDNGFLDTAAKDEADRTAKQNSLKDLNDQLTVASTALGEAQTKAGSLKKQIEELKSSASDVSDKIDDLEKKKASISLTDYSSRKTAIDDIKNAFDGLKNKSSSNSSNNGNNNNNNNNTNNNPTPAVLPVAPVRPVTPAQQIVELTEDQTPLTATPDTITDAAKKPGKKVKATNTKATTDDKDAKDAKKPGNNKPKKVTPEVEDDTIDEDLEIVSLDDEDKVPLAPGVASNDSTKDIMDETSSVSWLWLIILAVASVVTFGTYKGVKKHNENKGKNNR